MGEPIITPRFRSIILYHLSLACHICDWLASYWHSTLGEGVPLVYIISQTTTKEIRIHPRKTLAWLSLTSPWLGSSLNQLLSIILPSLTYELQVQHAGRPCSFEYIYSLKRARCSWAYRDTLTNHSNRQAPQVLQSLWVHACTTCLTDYKPLTNHESLSSPLPPCPLDEKVGGLITKVPVVALVLALTLNLLCLDLTSSFSHSTRR